MVGTRLREMQIFQEVDTNCDGMVDAEELHAFLEHVHESQVRGSRPIDGMPIAFVAHQLHSGTRTRARVGLWIRYRVEWWFAWKPNA